MNTYNLTLLFPLLTLLLFCYIYYISIKSQAEIPWTLLILVIGAFFVNIRTFDFPFISGNIRLPLWIPIIFFLAVNRKKLINYFISKNELLKCIFIGLIGSLIFSSLIVFYYHFILQIPYNISSFKDSTIIYLIIYLIISAIENEIFFRGIIQGTLLNYGVNEWILIFIQTTIFTFSYTQYFSFKHYPYLVAIFIYGIVAGKIALSRKNILPTVLFHFFTTLTIMMLFVDS